MPIKRYTPKYVRTYKYTDKESGETEDIVFMANGYLFPLFKSLSGVELGTALKDYKESIMQIATPEVVEVLAKFDVAKTADEKVNEILAKPDVVLNALRAAMHATGNGAGLSLTEMLLIVTHVCALPADDHAEALSLGTELLPQEVYQDPALAFSILEIAMDYESAVKKNSALRATTVIREI